MIKNIVIDFDNTIANSSETALAYISDKYKTFDFNTSYDPSVLLWDFQPFITDKGQIREVLDYINSKDFFNNLKTIENVEEALSYFKKNNIELTLCTNRTGQSFDYVKEWLKKQNLYDFFNYVICVSSFDKNVINGEIIIDDKPSCMINDDRQAHIVFGNYRYTKDEFIDNFNSIKDPKSYKFCKDWNAVLGTVTDILLTEEILK